MTIQAKANALPAEPEDGEDKLRMMLVVEETTELVLQGYSLWVL